jgi:hypothetical protein
MIKKRCHEPILDTFSFFCRCSNIKDVIPEIGAAMKKENNPTVFIAADK